MSDKSQTNQTCTLSELAYGSIFSNDRHLNLQSIYLLGTVEISHFDETMNCCYPWNDGEFDLAHPELFSADAVVTPVKISFTPAEL